jgi:hypothetical protein
MVYVISDNQKSREKKLKNVISRACTIGNFSSHASHDQPVPLLVPPFFLLQLAGYTVSPTATASRSREAHNGLEMVLATFVSKRSEPQFAPFRHLNKDSKMHQPPLVCLRCSSRVNKSLHYLLRTVPRYFFST